MNILGSKLKLLWERITFSRLTTIYFVYSLVHCIIQVTFQIQAFTINDRTATFLSSVITQGNATDPNGFVVLGKNDLRFCDQVFSNLSTSSCRVIWNGTALDDNAVSSSTSADSALKSALATPESTSTAISSASFSTSSSANDGIFTRKAMQMPSPNATTAVSVSKPDIDAASAHASKTLTVFTIATAAPSGNDVDDDDKKHKREDIETIHIDGQVQVKIDGLGSNADVTLDRVCLWTLNYPVDVLLNTKREDITFIAFQLWVLGMSIVAILNESIPHIIASLLTHMLATAWTGYQISHTESFKADFTRLTTNGACKPFILLPDYWRERRNAEMPLLALNIAALLISVFLTWRLVKLFGWQTFKRVGASVTINRVYKLVLILSIAIQLALFFMIVTVALWIDQLWNGQIAHLAILAFVYKPVFIIVLILLVPWLMTGWFAVRRELRMPMLVFLVLSLGYLAGWGVMFASTTFRWTFVQWRFFSLIASASVLLTLMAFILGVICRLNFGKGLPRYLNAQELIPDERVPDPFKSSTNDYDPEKVDFPSDVIPTFSVAFGLGDEVPPPNQMFTGRQRGPRFYNETMEPFENQTHSKIARPISHNKSLSSSSLGPEHHAPHASLVRYNTRDSQRSGRSMGSKSETTVARQGSQSSQSSTQSNPDRWVIE